MLEKGSLFALKKRKYPPTPLNPLRESSIVERPALLESLTFLAVCGSLILLLFIWERLNPMNDLINLIFSDSVSQTWHYEPPTTLAYAVLQQPAYTPL